MFFVDIGFANRTLTLVLESSDAVYTNHRVAVSAQDVIEPRDRLVATFHTLTFDNQVFI